MTETPITDKEEFPCMTWPSRDHPMVVRSTIARQLERERDQARIIAENLRVWERGYTGCIHKFPWEE